MLLDGIHNVYNVVGVIVAAYEFLKLPYDKILESIATFGGVSGRMEKVATIGEKDVVVDFAHNPAGVETVLREFKNYTVISLQLLQFPLNPVQKEIWKYLIKF